MTGLVNLHALHLADAGLQLGARGSRRVGKTRAGGSNSLPASRNPENAENPGHA